MPAVLDEGNSVVCEGQTGVSNVYASALWEIDDQLLTAREGVAGDYEHGTVVECDSGKPLYMYYTPLCAPTAADAAAGDLAAQPEYYGLAAVHEIGTGDFLNVTNPDSANVHAYAIRHSDGTVTVVLDDFQDPSSNGATSRAAGPARVLHLGRRGGPDRERPVRHQRHHARRADRPVRRRPAGADRDADLRRRRHGDGQHSRRHRRAADLRQFRPAAGQAPRSSAQLSGKCLSVTGASTANGAAADIYTATAARARTGRSSPNGTIVGGLSGECLEVAGGSTANYAGVDIGTCDGAASQQWTVEANDTIVGAQSGKCLSVTGASTADRAPPDIYTCNGSGSETWN